MSEYLQGVENMTDFQFKQIIAMVYKIVKANHEAGKSVEEILCEIAELMETPNIPNKDN